MPDEIARDRPDPVFRLENVAGRAVFLLDR
jgi:hypothetical protein